jgi:hypothetical protein
MQPRSPLAELECGGGLTFRGVYIRGGVLLALAPLLGGLVLQIY